MKAKIFNILIAMAIVLSLISSRSAGLATPAGLVNTTLPLVQEMGDYYLEFNLPAAPEGYLVGDIEGWYHERFSEALGRLHPVLMEYVAQGTLEDFLVEHHQLRLTLINPAPIVLDTLGRTPDGVNLYPAQADISLQSSQEPESLTLRQMQGEMQDAEEAVAEPPRVAAQSDETIEIVTDLTPGHFRVTLWDSYVFGITSAIEAAFTASVTRDSVVIAEYAAISEAGYYYFDFYDFSGNRVLLQPGDVVTVAAAGDPVNNFSLPEIIVQVDATQNLVYVYAPANQPVTTDISTDGGYFSITGTTSSEGMFTADFTSQTDIRYDEYGWVFYNDALDTQNQVSMVYETPRLYGRINYSYLFGRTGQTGAGTHQVLVTQYNADGFYELSTLVDADNTGYFRVYLNLNTAGKRIEFTAPSGEIVSLTFPELTVQADPVTDTVSGQAPANASLDVELYNQESWYFDDVIADGSGFYSTNFDGAADISPRDYGYVYYYLPDGNWVYISYTVPYAMVNLVTSTVSGYIAPYEAVTVNLMNSTGTIKASSNGTSNSSGYFSAGFWNSTTNTPLEILTGDSIQIISTTISAVIDIPLLSANVDQNEDTISGQGIPSLGVETQVCFWVSSRYQSCHAYNTQADASGYYLVDYSEDHDIRSGDNIRVFYSTIEGYTISDDFYLPNLVYVYPWENTARVYTTAYSLVEVTLSDSHGEVKAFYTGSSDYQGYLYLGTLGDIAPGDQLAVTTAGVTTLVTVADLQITSYDREDNVLTGRGPANTMVAFYLRDLYGDDTYNTYTILDAEGYFTLDLSGLWNLRGGDSIRLQMLDEIGAVQYQNTYVPGMTADLINNLVSGYGTPSSTVVVYLKDSGGDLKASAQATVSTYGNWYVYLDQDILPGDTLEMDNAGMVTSLVVQGLTLSADPLTDIVSGSAPADSWVYLYSSSTFQSYNTYLSTATDGSFSVDLSAIFNIQNLSYVGLDWFNDDADGIRTYNYLPGIGVYADYDSGYGYSSTPDALITLTLSDANGTKATAQVPTSATGYFSTNGFCDAGSSVDIFIGDTLASTDADVRVAATNVTMDVVNDIVSGTTTPNAVFLLYLRSATGAWFYYRIQVTADVDGTFSIDLSGQLDLQLGDYAEITLLDTDGDAIYYFYSTVSNTGSAAIISYPDAARPNSPLYIGWEVGGGLYRQYTYLRWDTESHACDRNYRYSASAYSGDETQFTGLLTAPAAGTIYVTAYAIIDGYRVWSPEIAIPVQEMAPVITDPVNGTTNDSTPTLQGFGPAGEVIEFYRSGSILLGSTTVRAEGTFSYTLPAALTDGEHLITARVPAASLVSNTVYLTVNNSLLVDPNHIFFTDRGTRFRIHDEQGYANLGGQIWIRPNDTVQIELPVRTCSEPYAVTLTVGAVVYDMFYAGDEVWIGSFLLPSSDYAIIANINCGGTVTNILLTYGLIDPDGYVYDAVSGYTIQGAQVICYEYDEGSGEYIPWDAATWGQVNPQWTDADGYYSFIVPPGQYKVEATYSGYYPEQSPDLTVVDAPVHYNLPMDLVYLEMLLLPMIVR